MASFGRAVYGLGVLSVGTLIVWSLDLGAVFQPVPDSWPMPAQVALACLSGGVLVVGGIVVLAEAREGNGSGRTATAGAAGARAARAMRIAASAIALNFGLLWLLLLNVPNTLGEPHAPGNWESCGLNMTALAGAWILLARSTPSGSRWTAPLLGERGVRLARRVFAVGLLLIGFTHFALAQEATAYVPAWLPWRIGWVYLTGTGHVAAALAIWVGVFPALTALATVLEAGQITAFVVLTHIPAVWLEWHDRVQWAMLLYAVAIAGSAWLVAAGAEIRRSPALKH